MRILIISGDLDTALDLVTGFRSTGFNVDHTKDIEQGSFWARTTDYDLVIIDEHQKSQAEMICKAIRSKGKTMPIIVLSDAAPVHHKVSILDAGADDCVSKECTLTELTARARAVLRRPQAIVNDVLELDDLKMDINKYRVTRGSKQVTLTRKEFGLLEYLLRNQERVISRTALIEHVWDIHADLFSNTLETHILNLRRKIEFPRKRKLIHTISGRGYKLAVSP